MEEWEQAILAETTIGVFLTDAEGTRLSPGPDFETQAHDMEQQGWEIVERTPNRIVFQRPKS